MTKLIAGTFGLDGIAVRQKIGTASHKKRRTLGMKQDLGPPGCLNKFGKFT